jgi:hypothetical protein
VQRHGCGGTVVISANSDLNCGLKAAGYVCDGIDWLGRKIAGGTTLQRRMIEYFEEFIKSDSRRLAYQHNDWDTQIEASHKQNPETARPARDNYSEYKSLAFKCVHQVDSKHGAFAELMHAARFVGNLSAADGATILLPDLRVHAFGAKFADSKLDKKRAKLLVSTDAETVLDLSDVSSRREFMNSLPSYEKERGMRFWSAVSYVDRAKDALAFVSSVDGTLTACMALDGGVLIIEPITLDMEHIFLMPSFESIRKEANANEPIDLEPNGTSKVK